MKKKILSVLIIGTLLFSCGGTNKVVEPITPAGTNPLQKIADGWAQYELNNFDGAIILFNEARVLDWTLLDAYNGLGWSYFKGHNLPLSTSNFENVIEGDSTHVDALVGYALATFEKNEYSLAITTINTITTIDSLGFNREGFDEYFFQHDNTITSEEIRIVLALCYYYSGMFSEAFQQLNVYLDPTLNLDPESPTFKSELLRALKDL
ncbi:MAG: hypothetical protein GY863_25365 [bacterium]|nr:hypothetical protein [bacterium]